MKSSAGFMAADDVRRVLTLERAIVLHGCEKSEIDLGGSNRLAKRSD
jgi:hypothetical protein